MEVSVNKEGNSLGSAFNACISESSVQVSLKPSPSQRD